MNAAPAQGRCREPEPASCYFGFCESVGLLGLFGVFVLLVFVEPESREAVSQSILRNGGHVLEFHVADRGVTVTEVPLPE